MIGKLALNSTHSTRGLVKCIPTGRAFFRTNHCWIRGQFSIPPLPLSHALNNFSTVSIKVLPHPLDCQVLERDSKLRASLSVYSNTIINVLQGQERPSDFDADQGDHSRDLGCRKS